MKYTKQQLKAVLKTQIIEKDYTLFPKLDGKKMSRIYDFYLGYITCFDVMKEEPINDLEFKNLIKKVILEFFLTIMDE